MNMINKGNHRRSRPLSVVLTCANFMSNEMHLPKTPEDRAKWSAMGDYGAKLLDVYKKYTDEWAKAFPKQPCTCPRCYICLRRSSNASSIME